MSFSMAPAGARFRSEKMLTSWSAPAGSSVNRSWQRWMPGSGDAELSTIVPLAAGARVAGTYGAKGNGQLLCGYGFAVPDNTEPDGSSNDVLELALGEGRGAVALRPFSRVVHIAFGRRARRGVHRIRLDEALEGVRRARERH